MAFISRRWPRTGAGGAQAAGEAAQRPPHAAQRDLLDFAYRPPWRDLPERFGKWQTAYDRLDCWSKDGTFGKIRRRLQEATVGAKRTVGGQESVNGATMRAARCAAGAKERGARIECPLTALGRFRGGFATKVHISRDGKGQPLTTVLSPVQDHESRHCRS